MRKPLFIASLLASITFAQSAMAQEPADTFGTPISSAVVVSFADSSSTFRPNTEQAAHLSDAKQAALVTIRGRTSTDTPSARDEALALARAISARSYLVARARCRWRLLGRVGFARCGESRLQPVRLRNSSLSRYGCSNFQSPWATGAPIACAAICFSVCRGNPSPLAALPQLVIRHGRADEP